MENNATIKSIADELGLSISTVSRVINGIGENYRISKKTIDAVNQMVSKLNYVPNHFAKSLRTKKTNTIGLIVPDISNPWFAKIAIEIEKQFRKKGYNVLFCNTDGNLQIEKQSLQLLKNWMASGIIAIPVGLEYAHLLDTHQKEIPVVLVDRYFEGVDLPFVSTNDFEGAFEATNYLIENGHQKIACIQGILGTSSNIQRINGYKKALETNGIEIDEQLILGKNYTFDNGYMQAQKIIDLMEKTNITAIFSTGNQITLGTLKAFKEKNISIPDQISIVSFDEWDYSELLYTPLSTVSHMGDSQAGRIAVNILLAQINGKPDKEIENTLLPTQLIKRESVKNISI